MSAQIEELYSELRLLEEDVDISREEYIIKSRYLKSRIVALMAEEDYDTAFEDMFMRPDEMSDKEFRAYCAFRYSRRDLYPDYYTEYTIAPIEESEWKERVQELRDDGLWDE